MLLLFTCFLALYIFGFRNKWPEDGPSAYTVFSTMEDAVYLGHFRRNILMINFAECMELLNLIVLMMINLLLGMFRLHQSNQRLLALTRNFAEEKLLLQLQRGGFQAIGLQYEFFFKLLACFNHDASYFY